MVLNTETLELNNVKSGLLKNISEGIIEQSKHLHDEFDVIKEQYNILGEELSQLTNFVNTQTQLEGIKEDQKTQHAIKKQGNYTLLSSIAVIALTGVLLVFSAQEYNSNELTSELLIKIGAIQDKILSVETTSLVSQYKDFELELEYSITPNFREDTQSIFADMRVYNVGSYDAALIHQWEVTRYCDDKGNIHTPPEFDQYKSSIPYGIDREDNQRFFLQHNQIFPIQENATSFELFIVVNGYPKTPKEILDDPERRSTTRVQFDLVNDVWMPRFNELSLNCNHLDEYQHTVKLSTTDKDHFYKLK